MLLYNSAICDLLRESIQMMKWILLGNFSLSASKDHPPKKKFISWIFQHRRSVTVCWKIHEMRQQNLLWPVEADNQFSYFFTKVCFFFKKIVKNTKKIRKNQMTSKNGFPPYNLLGNLFWGGLVFCWYFKKIYFAKTLFLRIVCRTRARGTYGPTVKNLTLTFWPKNFSWPVYM